jgi:hypothetical protein
MLVNDNLSQGPNKYCQMGFERKKAYGNASFAGSKLITVTFLNEAINMKKLLLATFSLNL